MPMKHRRKAERKGLGTPATRAATIEKLVQRGFIERKGDKKTKHLIATDKGNALITVMPEQIQSPSMTAEWEQSSLASSAANTMLRISWMESPE